MNLNITGLQAGAVQGAAAGDAATAAAPSRAKSPFAMLLAILSGTSAEAQAQPQPQPQQPTGNPHPAQQAQAAFLSPAQIETNKDKPGEVMPAGEARAEGFVAPTARNPQIVPTAPELLEASPAVADGEQPAKDAVEFEGEEIAAPLPAQPRADLAVIAAVSADAALVQASQDANSSAPAQQQPQSAALDGEAANNQAPVEIGKAAPAAIAGVAVDPRLASAAAGNGKTPAAAPDMAEGVAPQERKQAATVPPGAPAPDAADALPKPDSADTQTERPAPLAPAEALKPAEPRAADAPLRAPDSVAAAPAQQADPGMARSAPAQQAAPQLPVAVPVEGLAIQIARVAKSGERKFEIRLDPPELGKVSVRLEVSREGIVTTHLTVERAETMDLLQRDARALERALGQAGLDQKGGGISFSLSDQNAHPQQDGREAPGRPYAMASEEMLPSENPAQPARFRSANALLDIRI